MGYDTVSSNRLSVEDAAAQMGVTPMFLRMWLRSGKCPFGTAVLMTKRWSYYINPERFRRYMDGADIAPQSEAHGHAAVRA